MIRWSSLRSGMTRSRRYGWRRPVRSSASPGVLEQRVGPGRGWRDRIDHGDFRWLHAPLTAYSQQLGVSADEITVRDSAFTVPEPMDLGFNTIAGGYTSFSTCDDGEISGNRFDGVNLSLGVCSIPVVDNEFVDTARPLWVGRHDDLALVDLAGPGVEHVHRHRPRARGVPADSSVAAGSTAVFDTTSGGVVVPAGLRLAGEMCLAAGTTIKSDGGVGFIPVMVVS